MTCRPMMLNGRFWGFFCSHGVLYDYEGILFELGSYVGPTVLNRTTLGERANVPMSTWGKLDKWRQLDESERESYRVHEEQNHETRTTKGESHADRREGGATQDAIHD